MGEAHEYGGSIGGMMRKNKDRRIVVAVDESEESMYALSWCLTNLLSQEAAKTNNNITNNTIVLLYVKPPPPAYSSMDPTGQSLSPSLPLFYPPSPYMHQLASMHVSILSIHETFCCMFTY